MTGQSTVQTLKGFRDFLPEQKRVRDWVKNTITKAFQIHGFEPIETPTLEYAELLLGKYGSEADKMVYTFEDRGKRKVGMRYDQTMPTARVLAQYSHTLPKYFRRYQIQNVFRAENTQKGRYREFTQCDCDLFGSTSPLADAEILSVFYATYKALGLDITIRINDRTSLFEAIKPFETADVSVFSIIQSIDKLDKLSQDDVMKELEEKGLEIENTTAVVNTVNRIPLSKNCQEIMGYAMDLGVPEEALEFVPSLARGLDYYTGLIFEGVIPEISGGSVGGGGRYDNLIKQLGGPELSAAGFAIGFDRTIEALEELNLLPSFESTARVLVTVFNPECIEASTGIARDLRAQGIATELYPHTKDALGKQIKYANDKKVPYVIVIGPDEVKKEIITLKNMRTGEETKGTIQEGITVIQTPTLRREKDPQS